MKIAGKKMFYQKAAETLQAQGFDYYDGDINIRGKGRSHASKPDYIAAKDGIIIIGEIKSPAESPKSGSWRTPQNSDSPSFKKVRLEVAKRERSGELLKEIGGHEIIIRGQIPDYIAKLNVTYDLPPEIENFNILKSGYTVPSSEKGNVEVALRNIEKNYFEIIDIGNGSTTFIYPL